MIYAHSGNAQANCSFAKFPKARAVRAANRNAVQPKQGDQNQWQLK